MYVYILKLQHGKYFVGMSSDVKGAIQHHIKGLGCKWTKIHKPVDILYVIRNCNKTDYKNITINLMRKCINKSGLFSECLNVRGGKYLHVHLDDYEIKEICREVGNYTPKIESHVYTLCKKCGRRGHDESICCDRNENLKYHSLKLYLAL